MSPRCEGDSFEVGVMGGGPAGAAAAITLAQAGIRCVIVEGRPRPTWRMGETLPPESRVVLQELGVWQDFLQQGHLSGWGVRSWWGSSARVEKEHIFNPHGTAWQLNRAKFEALLLKAAAEAGAAIVSGCPVSKVERDGGGWMVEGDGLTLRVSWLVDATGRSSLVGRKVGLRRLPWDKLVSVHTMLDAAGDTDQYTCVESRPDGWWYTALLPEQRRILAWQTDADLLAAEGDAWRQPGWLRERLKGTHLMKDVMARYDHESCWSAPDLVSALTSRMEPWCGEGWLAVGDASQSFDPLSGQGLFHALAGGRRAALALVADALPSGEPSADGAIAQYGGWLDAYWERFLFQRKQSYLSELRWREQAFWKRRGPEERPPKPHPYF